MKLTRFLNLKLTLFLLLSSSLLCSLYGQSWHAQQSNANQPLVEIFFLNPQLGWALGENSSSQTDYLRKTTDGGINWISQNIGRDNLEIEAAYFIDENKGFVVGELNEGSTPGFLATTTDGGQSWTVDEMSFNQKLLDITFVGRDSGWIVGNNGYIAHTSNGGQTWTNQSSPTDRALNGIDFFDHLKGLAVGDKGKILLTLDGGQQWLQMNSPTDEDFLALSFGQQMNAWAVGDKGKIARSLDGGESWHLLSSGTDERLFDIDALNDTTLWVVGKDAIVLSSTNAGDSWSSNQSNTDRDIMAIDMLSDTLGWFSGKNGIIHILGNPLISGLEEERFATDEFSYFPNPVSQHQVFNLVFQQEGKYEIGIYNTTGALLWSNTESGQKIEVSTENLSQGIYWISFKDLDKNKIGFAKIIVN